MDGKGINLHFVCKLYYLAFRYLSIKYFANKYHSFKKKLLKGCIKVGRLKK